MTEVLFFGGVWIALSCIAALLLGRVLSSDVEEEAPVVNFHQRRQVKR